MPFTSARYINKPGQHGQDLIEYSLLMAFVALASAALFLGAGGSIKGIWQATDRQLWESRSFCAAGQTSTKEEPCRQVDEQYTPGVGEAKQYGRRNPRRHLARSGRSASPTPLTPAKPPDAAVRISGKRPQRFPTSPEFSIEQ